MSSRKYIVFLLIMIVLLPFGIGAKTVNKKPKARKKEYIMYPAAPDTARIQYLVSFSGSDFLGKRSKFSSFILGPEDVRKIGKPYGMAIRNGKLYVCDPPNGGLDIIDFETKKYSNFTPGGKGALKSALNCDVDVNEYTYVADPVQHQVVVYDSLGTYVALLKDTAASFKPTDLMIFHDEIWVTNPTSHTLSIYDKKSHNLIRYFNEEHKYLSGDDGFLYSPFNLFITDDKVYITDFGDFKIKVYDHQGKYLNFIGSYGTGIGQFVRPKGIACDKDSNLYVVDAGFENTQIFNKEGQLLMPFGGPYKGPGDMWLPAKVIIDYDNLKYFSKYLNPDYDLKYLIFVSNQYGPDKVNVYGAITLKNK